MDSFFFRVEHDLLRSELFVTSGYLETDEPELPGWRLEARRTLDGWAAALFGRR